MTIISATCHTYKSRVDGTLVATILIEPNDRAAYLEMFGMPGVPMGIARLTTEAAQEQMQASVADKPKGGALSTLAGRWCKEQSFFDFIRPEYDLFMGGDGNGFGDLDVDARLNMTNEDICRHAILVLCNIESRAELDHNNGAADKFERLIRQPYMEYINNLGPVSKS